MKVTRAWAEEFSKEKGYDAIQIDGIPEGFAFKKPDVSIGTQTYPGEYVAFIPLAETGQERSIVTGSTIVDLLQKYNAIIKK